MFAGRYRYVVALLLFLSAAINYIDRSAIGVIAPFLESDLHLSPSQLGTIFSAFFAGYTVFAFIGGWFADRFGPATVLSWAVGSWSVLSGLTAAAFSYMSLLLIRVPFGMAEGPMLCTTNGVTASWFTRKEIGSLLGTILSGQMFGAALAGPLVGFVALRFGWRAAFVLTGIVGLIWLACWRLLVTDRPDSSRHVRPEELALIQESRRSAELHDAGTKPLRAIAAHPSTIGMCIGLFANNYTINNMVFWLPTYFTSVQHLDVRRMSLVLALPWMAGIVGSMGGGVLSDRVYRRVANPIKARRLMVLACLACSSMVALLISSPVSLTASICLAAAALLLVSAAGQGLWVLTHEVFPPRYMSGVSGMIHCVANFSGIIGPTVTGLAIQYFGGFEVAFRLCALLSAIGLVSVLLLVRKPVEFSPRPDVEFGVRAL